MFSTNHSFLQALGWAILNSFWQMALLWLLFQLTIIFYKKASASQKGNLAVITLISGFAWFLFTLASAWLAANQTSDSILPADLLGFNASKELHNWLNRSLPVASVTYLFLLILPVAHFIKNYRYVHLIKTTGLKKIHIDWRIFVKKIASQIDIRKPVGIWVSELVASPVTVGFIKPVILVPAAVLSHLSPKQVEAILLHELAHIKRYDYLFNLIITFIQTILYYNPFVKALVKTVEAEREKSCDELVVRYEYNAYDYAAALLLLEKQNIPLTSMALAASGKNNLLNRIEEIVGIKKKTVFTFNKLAGLVAGILCVISVNALFILGKPATTGKRILAINQLVNPFYYFSGNSENDHILDKKIDAGKNDIENNTEIKYSSIQNKSIDDKKSMVQKNSSEMDIAAVLPNGKTEDHPQIVSMPDIKLVNYITNDIPALSKEKDEEIKGTLATTRRVLESVKWKEIEKSMADALTAQEKAIAKAEYEKQVNNINWAQMEDRLKLAYEKVNWNNINLQLNTALTDMKLDSLQQVYTVALKELKNVEASLAECQKQNIAVPEISAQQILIQKQQALQNLEKIKAVRSRKVIHL